MQAKGSSSGGSLTFLDLLTAEVTTASAKALPEAGSLKETIVYNRPASTSAATLPSTAASVGRRALPALKRKACNFTAAADHYQIKEDGEQGARQKRASRAY